MTFTFTYSSSECKQTLMHGRNVEGKVLALILTSVAYFEPGTPPYTKSRALHAVSRSFGEEALVFCLIFKGKGENVRRD